MLVAIAACDPTGVMGKGGKLPWHLPEDLDHFRRTTKGHTMVMGRITYESMPHPHKALVLSSRFIPSIEALLPQCRDRCFVIGGASVFRQFFERGLIDEAIITHVKKTYSGDTFFPLYYLSGWPSTILQDTPEFTIRRYVR